MFCQHLGQLPGIAGCAACRTNGRMIPVEAFMIGIRWRKGKSRETCPKFIAGRRFLHNAESRLHINAFE
jgi:hypothetical protein